MRGHGEGSVFLRKNGDRPPRWVAVVSVPGTGSVRRIARYAKTRTEAFAKLRELQAATLVGSVVRPPVVLLPPMPPAATRATRMRVSDGVNYLAIAKEGGWSPKSIPEARVACKLATLGLTPTDTGQQVKIGRVKVDFACPDVHIAIEVDGPHHRLPEIAVRDVERDMFLAAAGWFVFRVDAYAADDEMDNRLGRIVRFIRMERLAR